jgi:hypothetical protein
VVDAGSPAEEPITVPLIDGRLIFLTGPRELFRLTRALVAALMLLFTPVVDALCGALLLLGILVSFIFKVSGAGTTFPFWHMITLSLGFGAFALLYNGIVEFLSR